MQKILLNKLSWKFKFHTTHQKLRLIANNHAVNIISGRELNENGGSILVAQKSLFRDKEFELKKILDELDKE